MLLHRLALCATVLVSFNSIPYAAAQTPTPAAASPATDKAVMAQLVALQNAFVDEIKQEGFKPSLAPPKILIDNPPSFGRYEDENNTLHISSWPSLPPDQQARFVRLAAMLKSSKTPQQLFEDGVYRWVFIHEMSHWWQACQHKISGDHYAVEYGANRIAAAYWRLKDLAFMDERTQHFRAIMDLAPSPFPEGQSKEKYFNENYEQLGRTPAYTWFQASMVVDVSAESPAPSFHATLDTPVR